MYRRRSLHYADVERACNVWVAMAGAPGCGYVSRFCDRIFSYIHGNSGNSGWNLNTAWSVFREFEDYGKGKSGDQCRQISTCWFPCALLRMSRSIKIRSCLWRLIIVVLIAVLYWFFGTELGCSLRATGCNDKMARAQGINTDFNRVLGLMISNGLVALSGALLCPVSGLCRYQHGPRRHRHRSGCSYHRRGDLWKNLPQFWLLAACGVALVLSSIIWFCRS